MASRRNTRKMIRNAGYAYGMEVRAAGKPTVNQMEKWSTSDEIEGSLEHKARVLKLLKLRI